MAVIEITPTGNIIGATVRGISLQNIPVGQPIEALEDALEHYGVLIFPNQQNVTPAEQIAFSQVFGSLEVVDVPHALLPGYPEIFVVGNTGKKLVTFSPAEPDGELEWHTDSIHQDPVARASLLLAREIPKTGGDTLFACMYSAYDSLDAETRSLCDTLDVVNSVSAVESYIERQDHAGMHQGDLGEIASSTTIRPLVRAHPRTGRRALYFGNQVSVGIVGWPEEKAQNFIAWLTEHAWRDAFQYCHKWHTGDAVFWDNRRVLHAGTPYDITNSRRQMHRTTISETIQVQPANTEIQ